MTQLFGYLVPLVVFMAIYAYIQRHPNWSVGESGRPYTAPGWWRPIAVGGFFVVLLFVVFASIKNGFHWRVLLAFPVLGAAFALGVLMLKALGGRSQLRR